MDEWPSDWMRSVLQLSVLRLLADGPTYGYAIGQRLAEVGLGTVKGGTLYPVLTRLEQAGHVTVEWRAGDGGPGRKYYQLTAAGEAELARTASRWLRFVRTTTDLVGEVAEEPTSTGAPR